MALLVDTWHQCISIATVLATRLRLDGRDVATLQLACTSLFAWQLRVVDTLDAGFALAFEWLPGCGCNGLCQVLSELGHLLCHENELRGCSAARLPPCQLLHLHAIEPLELHTWIQTGCTRREAPHNSWCALSINDKKKLVSPRRQHWAPHVASLPHQLQIQKPLRPQGP